MASWKDGIPDEWGYDRYESGAYDSPPIGTEILVECDWAGNWEFEKIVVWRNVENGELRAAYDAGCSCPNPFAGLTWDGMLPITEVADLNSLFKLLEPLVLDGNEGVAEIKAKVHRALRDSISRG